MPENYKPEMSEINEAKDMMSAMEREQAFKREAHYNNVKNPELLSRCDLTFRQDTGQNNSIEYIIGGTIDGHEVTITQDNQGFTKAVIDGGKVAADLAASLYKRYLAIAVLQDYDHQEKERLATDDGKANMVASKLLG